MTKSRNLVRKRWKPDAVALELMRQAFSTSRSADIALVLGVERHQVEKLAHKLGLKKDPAWLNGPGAGRFNGQKGASFRFQPGHKSWNKGKKLGSDWCSPSSKATQFRAGQKPMNHKPVGSLRVDAGGYLQIKLHDTGYPPRDWVMYHRHVWQQAHGPVPAGHVVGFKAGQRCTDPERITPDVLECISKREVMARNSVHQFGPEIAGVVALRAALTRQINRRAEQEAGTPSPQPSQEITS